MQANWSDSRCGQGASIDFTGVPPEHAAGMQWEFPESLLRHDWEFPQSLLRMTGPNYGTSDTGHKALCPVSLPRTRAYYVVVPGHTMWQ